MKEGIKKVKGSCEELIKLIRHKTGSVEDEATSPTLENKKISNTWAKCLRS